MVDETGIEESVERCRKRRGAAHVEPPGIVYSSVYVTSVRVVTVARPVGSRRRRRIDLAGIAVNAELRTIR